MHRLPFDIIREHIIPYTYKPQPKSLCRDIETFVAVKNALYDIDVVLYDKAEMERRLLMSRRTTAAICGEKLEFLTNEMKILNLK